MGTYSSCPARVGEIWGAILTPLLSSLAPRMVQFVAMEVLVKMTMMVMILMMEMMMMIVMMEMVIVMVMMMMLPKIRITIKK